MWIRQSRLMLRTRLHCFEPTELGVFADAVARMKMKLGDLATCLSIRHMIEV